MKKLIVLFVILMLLSVPGFAEEEILEGEYWMDKYVLILRSTKDYEEASRFAVEVSVRLGIKYDDEYREYSKEKGIYFSLDLPDDIYAGEYYRRRYGEDYISLENSSSYVGFEPGYIIVVGGVFHDKEFAQEVLMRAKKFYPDAYVKKVILYMGCIH